MIMNMIEDILTVALLAAGVINLILELKRDLMMLQQNSYRNERYMRWLRTSGDTTSVVRLLCYCLTVYAHAAYIGNIPCAVALIPLLVQTYSTRLWPSIKASCMDEASRRNIRHCLRVVASIARRVRGS